MAWITAVGRGWSRGARRGLAGHAGALGRADLGCAVRMPCQFWVFENICHAAEEFGATGFTLEDLVVAVPDTQAAVALAFLKERGCETTEGRRSYAAGGGVRASTPTP